MINTAIKITTKSDPANAVREASENIFDDQKTINKTRINNTIVEEMVFFQILRCSNGILLHVVPGTQYCWFTIVISGVVSI